MTAEFNLTEEDLLLWHYVSRDIDILPGKKLTPLKQPQQEESDDQPIQTALEKPLQFTRKPTQAKKTQLDYIQHGTSAGVDKATAKRLTGGKFKIEAKLDLHGKTQDQALSELTYFIRNSHESKKRGLLIITGKGPSNDGVLKNQTPRWLNTPQIRPFILMFSHAKQKHGGDGALYILLRK
jgi:DNA-nicking Smr family endonuclease